MLDPNKGIMLDSVISEVLQITPDHVLFVNPLEVTQRTHQ